MDSSTNRSPNPGSSEAIAAGCRCPVIDNHHGRGYRGGPDFLYVETCALHAAEVEALRERESP